MECFKAFNSHVRNLATGSVHSVAHKCLVLDDEGVLCDWGNVDGVRLRGVAAGELRDALPVHRNREIALKVVSTRSGACC